MRKTYKQLQQARAERNQAVHAMLLTCEFRHCDFFTFQGGNVAQTGTLVLSRTEPEERYLVLHFWPDVAGDKRRSKLTAVCPPGREKQAGVVCEAVSIFYTNGGVAGIAKLEEATQATLEEAKLKEVNP